MNKKQVPLTEGMIRDASAAGMNSADGHVLYFEASVEMVPPEGRTFFGSYDLVEVSGRTYPGTDEVRWFAKPNRILSLEEEVSKEKLPPKVVKILEKRSREASDGTTIVGKVLNNFLKPS